MFNKPKGTEDILPNNINQWHYLEETAQAVLESYNFKEIRTPIFESYDLFSRGVGDSTDMVSKEMYDFDDKGGRHIALRPEGTASIVRAFVQHKLYGDGHPKPLKVYYMGPMFRYERPQAGRQRQFHQIGVEVFGTTNPASDAEVIAMAWDLLAELGLSNLTLYINSLGKSEDRLKYRQALIDYFTPYKDQLSEDSQRRLNDNPLRILDSKSHQDQELVKNAPRVLDYLSEESQSHFQEVKNILDLLDIPYTVDSSVVRGIDYYQDTIFEIMVTDNSIGAQSTVIGGGRYDGLVEELGGPKTPGVGFGLGMERLLLLMQEQNVEIPQTEGLDVFVVCLGDEVNGLALKLVQAARQDGLSADRDYVNRSIKSQYKTLEKLDTKLSIVLGKDEMDSGQVKLKNQQTGKESLINIDDLLEDFIGHYRKNTVDTSVIDKYFGGK